MNFRKEIETAGFYLTRETVDIASINDLLRTLEQAKDSPHARSHEGETYALRNILRAVPGVYEMAIVPFLMDRIRDVLGSGARPVKAILFDKTESVNWNLKWHQDNVIAVQERRDVPGFSGWSEKVGIPHVRPPVEVLQQMLAARIHLDDCPADNGALKVLAGSHAYGRLSAEEFDDWCHKTPVVCSAAKGQVLFMRPLLLHSSARAANPRHRRVLHVEYAASDLPGDLVWAES
jgi:hypothetical protein